MLYVGMLITCILGAFVQTLTGFGAAVFIILYLTSFMPISSAPSICAVVCLILNVSLVIQFRKYIKIKPILKPMIIYSAISLITVFFIKSFKVTLLSIFFGIFLICISIYYLFLSKKIKINETSNKMMILSSSLSGLFAGLFTIGGPTLSVYYLALCGNGGFYIASIQLSFLTTNVVLIIGRICNGLLTMDMLPMIVAGCIGAFVGQITGKKIRNRISTNLLSKIIYVAVGLSGLMVIIQQL